MRRAKRSYKFLWIEEKIDNNWSYVWVKIPYIPAHDNATVYIYFGNPSATSESNASSVFIMYDDFEDGIIDPHWINVTSVWNESQGYIECINQSSLPKSLVWNESYDWDNYVLEVSGFYHTGNIYYGVDLTLNLNELSSSGSFNVVGLRDRNTGEVFITKYEGGWNLLASDSSITSYAGDVIFCKITKRASNITINCTDYNQSSSGFVQTSSGYTQGYVGIFASNGSIDWIRVRKYTSLEPTYSFGSKEELEKPVSPTVSVKRAVKASYPMIHILFILVIAFAFKKL